MGDASPLLRVADLAVDYRRRRGAPTRAVEGVSFDIANAETLGLVGESGSGKSTIGSAVLGLVPVAQGTITFDGEDISHCTPKRRRELTREIQVIYQDPYGSLNPARTVGSTLAEPLSVHEPRLPVQGQRLRVSDALESVGMPAGVASRYPTEFSGGQRQRIAIARALIMRPRLIVCDEAVSALDLSIQAQVLNLLEDFRQGQGVSYLFITHDLAVVRHIAARVLVLHRGGIVESGTAEQVATSPRDPYTAMLQAAAPVPDPAAQRDRRTAFRARLDAFTKAAPADAG